MGPVRPGGSRGGGSEWERHRQRPWPIQVGRSNTLTLAGLGSRESTRKAANYARLNRSAAKKDARLRALIQNDLAVLDVLEGKFEEAREGWQRRAGGGW